ncbi:MAG: hypothetical protein M3256_26060 [Actinomycetota bacterium]|nr:hypothetical protein [Actinomycetota bacterium]
MLDQPDGGEAFRAALGRWAQLPGYDSFRGFGQMWVNQYVGHGGDPGVLRRASAVPRDEDAARSQLESVLAQLEQNRRGGAPAPRRTLFVLSLFWTLQDWASWLCIPARVSRSVALNDARGDSRYLDHRFMSMRHPAGGSSPSVVSSVA